MKVYFSDENEQLIEKTLSFKEGPIGEFNQLKVYPNHTYQKIVGFGGAFTEAAAYTYANMGEASKKKLIDLYFGTKGNRYSFCRTHIQSCDFSLGNYAYINEPTDKLLTSFSIERDKEYLIPLIKAALKKNSRISILASPWSPPGFMKTNQEMNHGGKLMDSFKSMWASMIATYLDMYDKEGIHISRLTVQNEPAAVQTWDSCTFTGAEEAEFVRDYLKPALSCNGHSNVKINVWDHNKDIIVERLEETFDVDDAENVIDGIGYHWYTGDHFEALKAVREQYPDKELLFTEGCVEYSRFDGSNQLAHAEMYAHDMVGNLVAGTNGWLDWNIYLNSEGGPNHVGNYCSAPVMCDIENDKIDINLSYYYIGHFSRFITPGAKRILVSSFTSDIETCGFLNEDGTIAVVALNRTDKEISYNLTLKDKTGKIEQRPHSIVTFLLEAKEYN